MSAGFTCTKEYLDIPFAHRQPTHDGHCALVHGHNWGFRFTFQAGELDENGFVFDFGKLRPLKARLEELDHALVIQPSDPYARTFQELEDLGLARIVWLDHPSAEGLAAWAWGVAESVVREASGGRARCVECVVLEDSKNSAAYRPRAER